MIQEILMWICVVSAFTYTAYALAKAIWGAYQQNNTSGCAGTCGGCSAKNDLLKQVKNNQIRPIRITNTDH